MEFSKISRRSCVVHTRVYGVLQDHSASAVFRGLRHIVGVCFAVVVVKRLFLTKFNITTIFHSKPRTTVDNLQQRKLTADAIVRQLACSHIIQ